MPPATFADILPITRLSSHFYTVTFEDAWCIGSVPNGGYTTSAFLICARTHMQTTHTTRSQPHPINLHLQFLRRTAVGPATLLVRDIKLGSRISNLHLTLYQNNNLTLPIVEGYIMMSNLSTETGYTLDTSYRLHPPPLPANLHALRTTGEDTHYTLRRNEPFPNFRRAALNVQMYLVRPSSRPSTTPRSIGDQWIRFYPYQNPGKWTNDALGFLVDLFPQIIEQYINTIAEDAAITEPSQSKLREITLANKPETAFWYPTLALNLDVKKLLPPEGVDLLFVRVQAKIVRNGRFDLEIGVWDEGGGCVALSTHASLVLDSSRNLTRSSDKGGEKKGKGGSKL